jgi:hypothetical protein
MKKIIIHFRKPLAVSITSIAILAYLISDDKSIRFSLGKGEIELTPQTPPISLKLGVLPAGEFHAYTKWMKENETVGVLYANTEIKNSKGETLVSHVDSQENHSTMSFSLPASDELSANIKIVNSITPPNSEAVFILAPKKTWPVFLIAAISLMGIALSIIWSLILVRKYSSSRWDLNS